MIEGDPGAPNSALRIVAGLVGLTLSLERLNRDLQKSGGITLTQFFVLQRLLHLPGISANQLAESVGVSPGTLTPMIKRLEEKELLFVSSDPRDARRRIISLTRQGKAALDVSTEKMQVMLDEMKDGFSASVEAVSARVRDLSHKLSETDV